MKKDFIAHYMVKKKESAKKTDIEAIIKLIFVYIQNKDIYFEYEPTFFKGVLIFGIVGFKKDHDELKRVLGADIDKLGGTIEINLYKEKK